MTDTYSKYADVCTKFYSLTLDSKNVAQFIFNKSRAIAGQNVLFVGGMFEVASELIKLGLNLTFVDYTNEMIKIAKSKFPDNQVLKSDKRTPLL